MLSSLTIWLTLKTDTQGNIGINDRVKQARDNAIQKATKVQFFTTRELESDSYDEFKHKLELYRKKQSKETAKRLKNVKAI